MSVAKLSVKDITHYLTINPSVAHDFKVIVEDSIASTNDQLMQILAASKEQLPKTALLAEMQTSGRGRHGRSWVSVPGNILMSVYWPFFCNLEKLYGLSLVIGIAIARVLRANGLVDVQLKWPNDIYWHNHKMGGILIETKQNRPGIIDTIIGVGLNIVKMDEYSEQIDQQFVALEDALQQKVNRDKLVAELILELNTVLNRFAEVGFGDFIEEWKALDSKIASATPQDMDLLAKIISADKNKPGSK